MLKVRKRFLNIWRENRGFPAFLVVVLTIKRKYAGIVSSAATESREFKSSTRATPFTQNVKNKRELQLTSCYHIYKSLSQFKSHKNVVYSNQKQTWKERRKHFCAKVAKMFEFTRETLNLNDAFKNFRKLFYILFVIKAVCFSRLTQSEYSSGKKTIHHLMQEG